MPLLSFAIYVSHSERSFHLSKLVRAIQLIKCLSINLKSSHGLNLLFWLYYIFVSMATLIVVKCINIPVLSKTFRCCDHPRRLQTTAYATVTATLTPLAATSASNPNQTPPISSAQCSAMHYLLWSFIISLTVERFHCTSSCVREKGSRGERAAPQQRAGGREQDSSEQL